MPRTRSSLLAVALAASGALIALPVAPASAWTTETLYTASDGGDVGDPQLALDASGELAVAWTEYHLPARRGAPGAWNETHGLVRVPGRADEPFTWEDDRTLVADAGAILAVEYGAGDAYTRVATRPSGGAFGPLVEVAPDVAQVAVSRGGARIFAYEDPGSTTVLTRVQLPGGVLGPVETVGPEGRANGAQFAISDAGEVVMAWSRYDGGTHHYVETRTRSVDGTWSAVRTLGEGDEVALAMNRRGDAVVAWRGETSAQAAYRPAGGSFGTVAPVSVPYAGGGGYKPLVAVDPAGGGRVLSLTYRDGALQPIEETRFAAGGAFGTPGQLAEGVPHWLVALRYDEQGTAWLVHATSDGMAVRSAAAGGAFGPQTALTDGVEDPNTTYVKLAVDDHGGAAVAWDSGGAAENRMRLATHALPEGRPGGGGGGQPGGGGEPGGGEGSTPRAVAPSPQPAGTPRPAAPATVRGLTVRVRGGRRTVAFTLSAAAPVRLAVQRAAAGRKVGKACVKPTRRNRGRAACTRWVAVGRAVTHAGAAGANTPKLTLPVKAGRYRVVATPAGGRAATAAFTVKSRRR